MQNNQLGTKRSPVSNDGRGLKQQITLRSACVTRCSPVSNDGRGLKQTIPQFVGDEPRSSPVSNDGRGLKLNQVIAVSLSALVRPSAMTGAD